MRSPSCLPAQRSAVRGCWLGHFQARLAMAAYGDFLHMPDELPSASLPRIVERECAAGVAGDVERAQAGRAQVLVKHANRVFGPHGLWTGARKGPDRKAARERIRLHS